MSSSAHVDNKEKYILILGEGPTQEVEFESKAEQDKIIKPQKFH